MISICVRLFILIYTQKDRRNTFRRIAVKASGKEIKFYNVNWSSDLPAFFDAMSTNTAWNLSDVDYFTFFNNIV